MIATLLLAATLLPLDASDATKTIQRYDLQRYARSYSATVDPLVAAINRAWEGDTSFYAGSEKAVTLSTKAQSAKALCPRTLKALGVMPLPESLTKRDQDAVARYHALKIAMYRQRCLGLDALVAYYDNPESVSTRAAMRRYNSGDERAYKRATEAVAPVFRHVGARFPADW